MFQQSAQTKYDGSLVLLDDLRNIEPKMYIIRPPRTLVPEGLMFYPWCFFYFFRHAISELPRPIAVKLCHVIAIWVRFIMQVQKFGEPSPKKLGAKNMQNSARFQTTFEFDRKYLQKESRYPKSENVLIESDSSRVLQKVRWTLAH